MNIQTNIHPCYEVFVLRNTYAGVCQLPLRDLFSENTVIGASIKEIDLLTTRRVICVNDRKLFLFILDKRCLRGNYCSHFNRRKIPFDGTMIANK